MTVQLAAIRAVLSATWQKVLPFVLKNWKILLILALSAALFFKMRGDYKALEDAMETARSSYEAQIEGIRRIHKDEMDMQMRLVEEYQAEINDLREDYEHNREELERERNRKIGEIEREWSDHPEGVAEQIKMEFGFDYVE